MRTSIFTRQAMVAGLYIALSLAIAPLSFGMVQARFAEALMYFVYVDARYSAALILGCLFVNAFSPLGPLDAVCGTAATALCCYFMRRLAKPHLALAILPIGNGLIVGAELAYLFALPFWLCAASVAAGELVAALFGWILYKKLNR